MNNVIFFVNGEKQTMAANRCVLLSDFIKNYIKNKKRNNLAVAVNNKLIVRSKWNSIKLKKNDKIEIVSPYPGGWY